FTASKTDSHFGWLDPTRATPSRQTSAFPTSWWARVMAWEAIGERRATTPQGARIAKEVRIDDVAVCEGMAPEAPFEEARTREEGAGGTGPRARQNQEVGPGGTQGARLPREA